MRTRITAVALAAVALGAVVWWTLTASKSTRVLVSWATKTKTRKVEKTKKGEKKRGPPKSRSQWLREGQKGCKKGMWFSVSAGGKCVSSSKCTAAKGTVANGKCKGFNDKTQRGDYDAYRSATPLGGKPRKDDFVAKKGKCEAGGWQAWATKECRDVAMWLGPKGTQAWEAEIDGKKQSIGQYLRSYRKQRKNPKTPCLSGYEEACAVLDSYPNWDGPDPNTQPGGRFAA